MEFQVLQNVKVYKKMLNDCLLNEWVAINPLISFKLSDRILIQNFTNFSSTSNKKLHNLFPQNYELKSHETAAQKFNNFSTSLSSFNFLRWKFENSFKMIKSKQSQDQKTRKLSFIILIHVQAQSLQTI